LYCIVCMQDDHEWRKFWDSCKSRAARYRNLMIHLFCFERTRSRMTSTMILGFWWCWWEYYWETIEESGYGTAMKLENTRIGACNVRFPSCGGCWGGEEGENVVNVQKLMSHRRRNSFLYFGACFGAGELHLSVSSLRVSVLWLSVWSQYSPHFGRKLALMTVWGLFVCHEFVVNLRALA
jgi:hypothetical protein